MRAAALLVLGLAAAGCDDPLLEAQRVESTRVIGARVESASDPAMAWPAPGEAAELSWLIADPRPTPTIGWAFSLCVAADTTRGVPECQAPPFAELSGGIGTELPRLPFVMPELEVLGDAERVLAQGAVCPDAVPTLALPLERSHCDGAEPELALIEIGVRRGEAANRNPSLADASVTLDGSAWPAPTEAELASATCSEASASPSLPLVKANGADHGVAVLLSQDDREPVERLTGPDLEELFVSHLSDLGRFERALSVIDPGQPPSIEVALRAPSAVDGTGERARVWIVVRDLRGGVDWTLRAVCFVP